MANAPRILTLDIETAPIESFHWALWDQNIGLNQIKCDWTILSFSAKWLDRKKVIYMDTGGRGVAKVRDDSLLLEALWALLDQADIVVTQNGKSFDIKKINARLFENGFKPYSPIRQVDTKLVAKKTFGFTSNKLEWMTRHQAAKKLKRKQFPDFTLWVECLKDNPKAWAEMKPYNIVDTLSTELLYLRMRPWIEGHPSVTAYNDNTEVACPKCGSNKVQKRGRAVSQTGEYNRYQCQGCGGWSRSRKTLKSRPGLLVP